MQSSIRKIWNTLTIYPVRKILHSLGPGYGVLWKVREFLKMPPASPMDYVRRKLGVSGLRYAYLVNLRIVLEHVAMLVERIPGKVVITSDHGEFLGERGNFCHDWGIKDPILTHVPWFVVRKAKISELSEFTKKLVQSLIKRRIRSKARRITRYLVSKPPRRGIVKPGSVRSER